MLDTALTDDSGSTPDRYQQGDIHALCPHDRPVRALSLGFLVYEGVAHHLDNGLKPRHPGPDRGVHCRVFHWTDVGPVLPGVA